MANPPIVALFSYDWGIFSMSIFSGSVHFADGGFLGSNIHKNFIFTKITNNDMIEIKAEVR